MVTTSVAPGGREATSSAMDSTFIATKTSGSRRRATQPSPLARTVNQVGRPWMLDGNMFLPLTGIPMPRIDRIRTRFADWLPVPFEVATVMMTSLTRALPAAPVSAGARRGSMLASLMRSLPARYRRGPHASDKEGGP